MIAFAGCDGGGSSCAVQIDIVDDMGNLIRSGRAYSGPANVRSDPVQALNNILSATSEAAEKVALGAVELDVYVAALAGAGCSDLRERWSYLLGDVLPAKRIDIVPDVFAVFGAIHASEPTIATIVGTGSIAWLKTDCGEAHRAGGLGPEVGDEGSGYWIVKQALMRCQQTSEFVARWNAKFGMNSVERVPTELAASFAQDAFELAGSDQHLMQIIDEAAGHITSLIAELAEKIEITTPMSWLVAGGVAVNQREWISSIRKSCEAQAVQLKLPVFISDPVVGAVSIARQKQLD